MLKAVLFDLDDTLFDHRHSSRSGLSVLQREFPDHIGKIPLDELERTNLEILNAVHVEVLAGALTPDEARAKRFGKLLRSYGLEPSAEQLQRVASDYRLSYQSSRRAVRGAQRLLLELRKRGLKTAIVSNNLVDEQMDKLRHCELAHLLDSLTISEEAGYTKPDVRIFQTALDRLGCRSEEVVIIGDSWENDILGGRAAGIRGIWYNCYSTQIPDETVPEIQSLEDFRRVIELLYSA